MNWLQNQALNMLLPYLLGPLVFLIMQGIKKLSLTVDKLPPWVKQALVFVVAQAMTFLQSWSGQELACGTGCTLADIGPTFVKGVLVTLSAFLMHFLKNRPAPKP
jgi:hypothetical protein